MSLATSYAQALYESAKETGLNTEALDRLDQQLGSFVDLLDASKDLHTVLLGAVVSQKEKVDVLKAISQKAGYTQILQNFLLFLTAKQRLPFFREIRNAFSGVRLAAEGGVSGVLVSAEPLSETDISGLAGAFNRKLGKKVAFLTSTDPALLAGVKVTVNGVTYDGTLRSQLQQLRDTLVGGYVAKESF